MPRLYIITGSNGAGKSSVGPYYLPEPIRKSYTVFNGDLLFMNKRKQILLDKKTPLKEAGRLATEWLFEEFKSQTSLALKSGSHFIYEGHLPEKSHWSTPQKFKRNGYSIHLIFLGLTNINLCTLRVLDRAKEGGHFVPPYEIERNFYGNLFQLNKHFRMFDEIKIIDTSESTNPRVLAIIHNGKIDTAIHHERLPQWFQMGLPAIYRKIVKEDKLKRS